jgi:hypothetical protein
LLLKNELPKLNEHFDKNEMTIEMFATDWVLGLFASIIPLQHMGRFYDNFFKDKWNYFYKTVLVFLKDIQEELLQEEEMCDVLVTLKTLATPLRSDCSPRPSKRSFKSTILSTLNKFGQDTEESSEEAYPSPTKQGAMRIISGIRDIFTKQQYECDWGSVLKRAQSYQIKDPKAVKEYIIHYDLTH